MSLDNSLRGKTTQERILTSIVDRLIDQIEELDEGNCFLSDQPVPISMPKGRYAVTVSMGPGSFPHEFFGGAGDETVVEDGSVVVTPIVVSTADRPRQKWKKITGATRTGDTPSVMYFKREILKAMLSPGWEPHDGDQPLLRDMLSPVSADQPQDVHVGETMGVASQIKFSTVFDWDLT